MLARMKSKSRSLRSMLVLLYFISCARISDTKGLVSVKRINKYVTGFSANRDNVILKFVP